MNLRFLILIALLAAVVQPALPQGANAPLGKDQVLDLVKYGMDPAELAKEIKEHGIDFEPSNEYLETLREAGAQDAVIQALREARPKPLTREQVGKLVAGGVPSERAAMLVKQHGIDFVADERYLQTLRLAGAEETLIAALREASRSVTAQLKVVTSPNAEVHLDGELQGRAGPEGELTIKAKPGAHALKASLEGKRDFEQSITLDAPQGARIEAPLVDLPGSIRVQTSAGAQVFLDNSSRGTADAARELVLPEVAPGSHELRVSAAGRREFRQSVTVVAGRASTIEARLENFGPTPGQVQKNPKDGLNYVWIAPGTFMMGCSPGDKECWRDEVPVHSVTITKGFWIGQTLVSAGAYKRFAGATGRQMPNAPGWNQGWTDDNMPIANVTWFDAQTYCGWAGGRLPTEAEWEYAARGGSTQKLYGPLDEIAWYGDKSGPQAKDVGQKLPNGFGLYDILGDVWQWVYDRYDGSYYRNSPAQDPQGPTRGGTHVLRGGYWYNITRKVSVSCRGHYGPTFHINISGFRCAGETFKP